MLEIIISILHGKSGLFPLSPSFYYVRVTQSIHPNFVQHTLLVSTAVPTNYFDMIPAGYLTKAQLNILTHDEQRTKKISLNIRSKYLFSGKRYPETVFSIILTRSPPRVLYVCQYLGKSPYNNISNHKSRIDS